MTIVYVPKNEASPANHDLTLRGQGKQSWMMKGIKGSEVVDFINLHNLSMAS